MKEKLKIGVLMGGKSAEHDISLETGKNIVENLDGEKYDVLPLEITRENIWQIQEKPTTIQDALKNIDLVFNAMHGEYGEDGRIQAILEYFNVPYTGSGVLASALAMDKIRSREVFRFNRILVPVSIILDLFQESIDEKIENLKRVFSKPPWVIKPVNMGSSVGVSIVKEEKCLKDALKFAFSYGPRILVEEYIGGKEVTCGVLENFKGEKHFALPVTEIVPPEGYEFFDYKAKYIPETQEITPAGISEDLTKKVQNLAKKAHGALGCRTYSRSDMIIRDNKIFLLETNTLPGLTKMSLFPKAAKVVGLEFPELLDKIVEEAMNR